MLQEIGAVPDAVTCQKFCKELYAGTCEIFMYDKTTQDCRLFSGSLEDLQKDCREIGYAVEPAFTECNKVFPVQGDTGCYVSHCTYNSLYIEFIIPRRGK